MDGPADQVREATIQDDAEQLKALEEQKSALDPSDPLMVELSHQVEALLQRISTKARAETELSEEIQGA